MIGPTPEGARAARGCILALMLGALCWAAIGGVLWALTEAVAG